MIEFQITFLIVFCLTKLKKPANSRKKVAAEKNKKHDGTDVNEVNKNIIQTDAAFKQICHIEYDLIPVSTVYDSKTEIDVIVWGEVAKVFTKEDVRCIRCYVVDITMGKVMFVSFSVLHKFPYVNNETLFEVSKEKVTFTFSQLSTKMTKKATSDFPTEFYDEQQAELDEIEAKLEEANAHKNIQLHEIVTALKEAKAKLKETEVIGNVTIWFREVAQTKPEGIDNNLSSLKHESYLMTHPDTEMCTVFLGVPIEQHRKKVVEKINKLMKTLPNVTADLLANNPTVRKTQTGKSKISQDTPKLSIDWYKFYCDFPVLKAEMNNISSTIMYSGVMLSTHNVLTYKQKIDMNPIVIKMNSLHNLPQMYVDKYRIQKVFLKYCLPEICDVVETAEVDIKNGESIRINHCFVNFIGYGLHGPDNVDQSVLTVSQRLQTQLLAIKVYGKFEIIKKQIDPCIFGEHPLDTYISAYHKDMENCAMKPTDEITVLLGTAKCDLSPLMFGHLIHEYNVNINSEKILFKKMMNLSSLEELNYKELDYTPFIPASEFITNGTYLQMTVKIASRLQFPSHSQVFSFPDSYSRIIVLFYDDEIAVQVLKEIHAYNIRTLMDKNIEDNGQNYNVCDINYESSNMSVPSFTSFRLHNEENLSLKRMLTGFFVANTKCNILVAEGLTNFSFPILLQEVFNLPTQYGRVLQNNCLIFNKRLYHQFYEDGIQGGIFVLALDEKLENFIYLQPAYLSKNTTNTAWQTLMLLLAICECKTLTAACQKQLFPTVQQLYNFEIEFCTKNYTQ